MGYGRAVSGPEKRFTASVVAVYPNRIVRLLGLLGLVLSPLPLAAAIGEATVSRGDAPAVLGLVTFVVLFPAVLWGGNVFATRSAVQIRADAEGLWHDDVLVAARTRLRDGYASLAPDGSWRVHLRRRRAPPLRMDGFTREGARELLAALGLDRRAGTTRIRLPWLTFYDVLAFVTLSFVVCMLSLLLFVGSGWYPTLLICALSLVFPLAHARSAWREVVVGVDGIELRAASRRLFLAYRDIAGIKRTAAPGTTIVSPGFELRLRDGRRITIDTRRERFRAGAWRDDPAFDAAVLAWKACSAGEPSPRLALLDRAERSASEWQRDLRSGVAGGYRSLPASPEALFEVLRDANAPRPSRAAAAVRLSGDAEQAVRLRVAIDDIADEKIRKIASAALGDDDDALEAALDQLPAEDHRPLKRSR